MGALGVGATEPPWAPDRHDPTHWECDDGYTNTYEDPRHCGDCDTVCPPERPVCEFGGCGCTEGMELCGSPPTCVDTRSDASHCGVCGRVCPGTCTEGDCLCATGSTCPIRDDAPWYDEEEVPEFDREIVGWTCVDTLTDPAQCGECGWPCPDGASCVGGECVCTGGLTHCAYGPSSRACVDVSSNDDHCGACLNGCHIDEHCEDGRCR